MMPTLSPSQFLIHVCLLVLLLMLLFTLDRLCSSIFGDHALFRYNGYLSGHGVG
jgi:hypothetical protein